MVCSWQVDNGDSSLCVRREALLEQFVCMGAVVVAIVVAVGG